MPDRGAVSGPVIVVRRARLGTTFDSGMLWLALAGAWGADLREGMLNVKPLKVVTILEAFTRRNGFLL